MPQDRGDLAVLRAVERDVLDPQVVEAALVFALDHLTRADTGSAARREDLRTELVRIEAELARYAEAIADAGALDTSLQAIKIREERRDAIRQELLPAAPAEGGVWVWGRDGLGTGARGRGARALMSTARRRSRRRSLQ